MSIDLEKLLIEHEKNIRLAFRIVALGGDSEDHHKLLGRIKTLFATFGVFFDSDIAPYPKLFDSSMSRVEFDIPLPVKNGIEGILERVGGAGWHVSKIGAGHEQDAIWAHSAGLLHPLDEQRVIWAQIQLISHSSLPISRKRLRQE